VKWGEVLKGSEGVHYFGNKFGDVTIMAAGQIESDFSVLCFNDKARISNVSECTCCINIKKELKELQDELSSAKLIIKLL
jgi:hypothetical protein